jgi:cytochrome c-type biogenesis protein
MLPTIIDEMDSSPSRASFQPGLGQKLPALALEPLTGDGKAATLEGLAGKVVVVNLWGTWCPPCRVEFPHLVELGKEFSEHPDFRIFLVSCAPGRQEDPVELKEETEAFLSESKYQVSIFSDPEFATRDAFHRVAMLRGFPTTFVLDREGVIRGIWNGFHPKVPQEIRKLVLRLVSAPGPAG